ncbi:MAG: magnesium transporter [Peptococcaceae bacterium]|nr:magnesium transporter [Peptococcaceae bacterium]MDH7524552.1 magnesium transporter [Peptococcaceae bacterium]
MFKELKTVASKISMYAAQQEEKAARELLADLQVADIAEVLEELETTEQRWVVSLLDNETAALVINELDPELGGELLGNLHEERVSEILEEMSSDDAADLLSELSDTEQARYLELLETEDQQDVRELMKYREDTAGGLMTFEYVAIREDITAAKAIEELRETAPDAETVYYVYVINTKNQLVGVISLRELIIASPDSLIRDIMRRNVISVPVDMDQEEVARIVSRYDFLAVPVVDHDKSLLGIITFDDVIDVINEEASEDIYRLAGAPGEVEEEEEEDFFLRIRASLKARLPWLFITMLGGLVSGKVLSHFSGEISAVVALAFFIPLLTGMGGNVGTQSSTVTVRGIATGQIRSGDIMRVILREALTGLAIGAVLGFIVGIVASWWQSKPMLGLVVGLAMLGNMFTAATMGTIVPLFFRRIGIDPAVASAPFISTAIDITGLVIYSTLATLLISHLL